MDTALWIASWIVAVGTFVAFAGLAAYGLALRRAAGHEDADPLRARRVQDAGALAGIAVALALGTQIAFVPFYARDLFGHTVRAEFVKVDAVGRGGARTFTLHATYHDSSGRLQPIAVQISGAAYSRYSDMQADCLTADAQKVVDREYARMGLGNPPKLGDGKCRPIEVVVVDGWPRIAQIGALPTVPVEGVVCAGIFWGILLFGLLRQARSRSLMKSAATLGVTSRGG